MAEISSAPVAGSHNSPEATGASDDGSNIRKAKPGKKRMILSLTALFSFILGLPFLLKSTEIYRSPLPFAAIDSLNDGLESNGLSFPYQFQVVLLGFGGELDGARARDFEVSISEQIRQSASSDLVFSVSVTVESGNGCFRSGSSKISCEWRCGAVGLSTLGQNLEDDVAVDEILRGALSCPGCVRKVYTAVVVNREEEVKVVVGKYRHSWISGKVTEAEAISMATQVFVDIFMNGGSVKGKGEFIPVGADGSVVLSFNLLHSDPNDWLYDWNFNRIHEALLAPIVEALSPIANISVESQVLYHTPTSAFSYWNEDLSSNVLSVKDLPFFVNSNEWHLDTSTAAAGRSKLLNFVVYIPSLKECPLIVRLPDGKVSSTNGFISPMWGGVVVWNPPTCNTTYEDTFHVRHAFPREELLKVFHVLVGQIRQLFGLQSSHLYESQLGISNFLPSERGFAEWELDTLFRQLTEFNLLSSASTLRSLSSLVQSLPRMIVMDEIGKQIKLSLEAAEVAQNNTANGLYDDSAATSREARTLAEDAFFHPSIMSLSYSSLEHYFAIYMPFFAPVLLHLLLAAVKELKRYKQEKAKYLRWLNQSKAT
ncbi:hypothetical protein H6P81_012387 [Aristolochia fimbriata]|uniref:GPI transamidase component PIG-S n=1 Tax=Aristolochia fimbriata TaxID=158543 RepID=A0AAV7ED90_ARIFI|nr:hypothetical protein H6P81_012387 [Aristolochia fimbriata]